MVIICEPYHDKVLLTKRIEEIKPKSVLTVMFHGAGDILMFLSPLDKLRELNPDITFDLGVQRGLTYETILSDAVVLGSSDNDPKFSDYDLVAKIVFPMSEHQTRYTKGEWCCIHELGIEPVSGHPILPLYKNKLVGVHFNSTCLPGSLNANAEVAERIWNDILEVGWIPLETHFQHCYHNPANAKFPFVDASVRRCKAEIANLAGLIQNCAAFVGVVSGNFHLALSILPPERVMLLERDIKRECFTKLDIHTANLNDYRGEVQKWLATL